MDKMDILWKHQKHYTIIAVQKQWRASVGTLLELRTPYATGAIRAGYVDGMVEQP